MQVKALNEVASVACGSHHTVAVLGNGEVYSWGMGWYGQLGHERVQQTKVPPSKGNPSAHSMRSSGVRSTTALQQKTHTGTHTTSRGHRHPHEAALNVRPAICMPVLGRAAAVHTSTCAVISMSQDVLERLEVYEATIACDLGHHRSSFADDRRAHCAMSPGLVQGLGGLSIRKIACGSRHTVAYQSDSDGKHAVWSW